MQIWIFHKVCPHLPRLVYLLSLQNLQYVIKTCASFRFYSFLLIRLLPDPDTSPNLLPPFQITLYAFWFSAILLAAPSKTEQVGYTRCTTEPEPRRLLLSEVAVSYRYFLHRLVTPVSKTSFFRVSLKYLFQKLIFNMLSHMEITSSSTCNDDCTLHEFAIFSARKAGFHVWQHR